MLTQHVLRRIVATIRAARHGGTLILVPRREVTEGEQYMTPKYRFEDEEPRRRFLTLSVRSMRELATLPASDAERLCVALLSSSSALMPLDARPSKGGR